MWSLPTTPSAGRSNRRSPRFVIAVSALTGSQLPGRAAVRSLMYLSGLFLYPVKSLGGISVATAAVDALGLVGDRRFMVVDEQGRFLTQRALPRMALIGTGLTAESLTLSAAGHKECEVPLRAPVNGPPPNARNVSVWSSEGLMAEDCGEKAAAWLGDFLALKCRLVRAGAGFRRHIPRQEPAGDVMRLGFADAFPYLVISEGSLGDLNDRLAGNSEEGVPMNRFRPNLVVAGCPPYAEDSWARLRIGDVVFRSGGPCARCSVTTTDQATAERGPEPLRTLSTYRRDREKPGEVNFGQNLFSEADRGTLRVGDAIEVIA